ncbi:hypothetical protein AWQ21_00380 [Picosynechococcus sp. PCC 7003]|uniref:DUF4327 family protein n=1 Tax=Picosynechococcus sp. PCC 7003 TaxID=374981 RepID=UPI0008106CC4|nr:DUF4327 family protein [Picosynechococcus sp. PCC 7003]ANV82984.1 hypothetical protein AWQ21_00380 [Picosynechococcus sp. PCC 7003]
MTQSVFALRSPFFFSLGQIRDEVKQLVEQNRVSRQQPIYSLCEYIPPREWHCIEVELERCGFLLRDCIGDLLGAERWDND